MAQHNVQSPEFKYGVKFMKKEDMKVAPLFKKIILFFNAWDYISHKFSIIVHKSWNSCNLTHMNKKC